MPDNQYKTVIRFFKNYIYSLQVVLGILEEIVCYNRSTCNGTEALCMFLTKFSNLCRYSDLIPLFGRPVPEICMISNSILDETK